MTFGRLPRPKLSTLVIYEIMFKCWKSSPMERPLFGSISRELSTPTQSETAKPAPKAAASDDDGHGYEYETDGAIPVTAGHDYEYQADAANAVSSGHEYEYQTEVKQPPVKRLSGTYRNSHSRPRPSHSPHRHGRRVVHGPDPGEQEGGRSQCALRHGREVSLTAFGDLAMHERVCTSFPLAPPTLACAMSGKQYHTPAEWMNTTTKLLSTAERDRAESEVRSTCG